MSIRGNTDDELPALSEANRNLAQFAVVEDDNVSAITAHKVNAGLDNAACLPEPVPLEKTVGYVIHDSVMHGRCVNVKPVDGLTECVGHCQSKTVHEPSKKDFN